LRKANLFCRPWLIESDTGNWRDLIDNKSFSTEFSHTRFLVPSLMKHRGWALFMDSDMIFQSDVKKLFDLCDDRYAVMCVKHVQPIVHGKKKMDGREQSGYNRKNWSSFVLFNCGHHANIALTHEKVNTMSGADLHRFSWLKDNEIGDIPFTYNFIQGVSPKLPLSSGGLPDVIHYQETETFPTIDDPSLS
jgi:lipopolysaccharide biosynthesis glycosyltransferase